MTIPMTKQGNFMSDIITKVDKFKQGWKGGLPETPCGSGSKLENTVQQREWIPDVIDMYDIETVADIGAGDLNWVKHIELPNHVSYKAYDLVPRLPEVNSFNLVEQVAPKVDLLICLWVLNHLEFDAARAAFSNLVNSGSRYLMMTDRPKWHHEQPPEIVNAECIDKIVLNEKQDTIKLIDLECY